MKKVQTQDTEAKLKSLYYDPRHGYTSITKFWKTVQVAIPGVTLAQVKQFLEKQKTYQVNKEAKKPSTSLI